jgi:hypothetical protein
MSDEFENFWKEIRMGNQIIVAEGIQKITKHLLTVQMITSSDMVVIRESFLDITQTFQILLHVRFGRERVAAIATRYTLNGSGIESRVGG